MGWIEMVGFVISWTQLWATPQNISDGSPLELIWWKSRKNNGKAVSQANKEICVPLQKRPEKFAHIFAFFFLKSQMCIFLGESVHFYPLFIPRGSSHLIWDNFRRVTRYLQRAIFGHNWHHIRPRDGTNPSTTHLPLSPTSPGDNIRPTSFQAPSYFTTKTCWPYWYWYWLHDIIQSISYVRPNLHLFRKNEIKLDMIRSF